MPDQRPALHLALGRLARRTGLTPTGIDRYDQAYLRHFAASPEWRLDPVTPGVWGFRSRPDLLPSGPRRQTSSRVTPGDVFLQCSHSDLDRPRRFAPFAGALRVFHVHDVIPLDDPEYCRDGEPARHSQRLQTLQSVADLIVVNSRHTAGRLAAVTGQAGPAIRVIPPGVEEIFAVDTPAASASPKTPASFVVLSSVEARKNVPLLLALWQRFDDLGDTAPRLVLIGADGLESEDITRTLASSSFLGRVVERLSGVDDAAVVARLRGARALLAPSLAEGFGLSIAEALAVGTPVIASDIPSHREVGGTLVDYVAPLDGPGWLAAIMASLAMDGEAVARRRSQRQATMVVRRWADHFRDLQSILDTMLAHRRGSLRS